MTADKTRPYPKYRVSQWLDTSEEAMARTQATIVYGVEALIERGGKWMHVAKGTEPLLFDSLSKASKACAELRTDKGQG